MRNHEGTGRIKGICLIICILQISGCAYSSQNTLVHVSAPLTVSDTELVFVMLALDGSYGQINYPNSGRQLSNRVLDIVRSQYPLAQLLEVTDELEAMNKSKQLGGAFLVSPSILHWEDRATAWSGFRDKVKVSLRLLRLEPRQVVAAREFESRNNSMTFLNTHPGDLLDGKFEATVLGLFR